MVRQLSIVVIISIMINGENMPLKAKPGQCFTKSFFPPKYTETTTIKSTKRILLRKSAIKYAVVPAEYKWVEKKVKISDGSEEIVITPTIYRYIHEKVMVEPTEKIWRKGLNDNAPKAFDGCVQSAELSGMDIENAEVGTCYYEHFVPAKYITTTEKILVSEPSQKIITVPAKYRTYTKKITTDATTTKLIPVKAKYKEVQEKVVIAPARSEWRKTVCQNRGCNQSEVVCLVEVPRQYKSVTKKILLTPSVAKREKVEPKYEELEIEEMIEPSKIIKIPIPAQYKKIRKKIKIENDRFFWSKIPNENDETSRKECDRICLTETKAKYETVLKKVVVSHASSKKIKTPPRYKMVRVKKIIKPASFKEIIVPAEYETVTMEEEKTRGFAKWIPIVCESNMTPTTIKKVQRALKRAGFYDGEINGIWDLESKRATRRYQKAKGLSVTRLSVETMKSLGIY